MKKCTLKKGISLLLAFLFAILLPVNVVSAVESEPTVQLSEYTTWTATDYDEDFPLNFLPVVDDTTVESLFETEMLLDTTKLVVDLQITGKTSFANWDTYTLTIHKDGEVLLRENCTMESVILFENVEYNASYEFCIYATVGNMKIDYIGRFSYGVDYGTQVFISMNYEKIEENTLQRVATCAYESEPNGSFSTADSVAMGQRMEGMVEANSDSHYFYFSCNGIQHRNVDLIVYCSDENVTNLKVALYSSTAGAGNKDYRSTITIPAGEASFSHLNWVPASGGYYIVVTATLQDPSAVADYSIILSATEQHCWYSQRTGYDNVNNIHRWNTERLDKVKFSGSTASGRVFVQNGDNFSTDDWMETGCFLTCWAMILRNMNEQYNCFDIRSFTSGTFLADPFTVTLANNKLSGSTYTNSNGFWIYNLNVDNIPAGDYIPRSPVATQNSVIANKFGVTTSYVENLQNLSSSNLEAKIRELLNRYGAEHNGATSPGILASLANGKHAVVITGIKDGTAPLKDRLIICEPYTSNYSAGANVPYSITHSGAYYLRANDANTPNITLLRYIG